MHAGQGFHFKIIVCNIHSNNKKYLYLKTLWEGECERRFWDSNYDISASSWAMSTVESALKSWDFILFDERTFRIIITHRKNSSPHLAHIHDFEIWERITKIKVGNKIMRVNGHILNVEEIWSCFTQKIIKNSSWRTPRQHFACQNQKIQKWKNEKCWKLILC